VVTERPRDPKPYDLTDAARTLSFVARTLERSLEDMTLPQFRVLTFLSTSPERASEIAEKAGVTRPSLTGVIDGLTAHGWVRRVEVDGDRRGVGLEITPAGRRALTTASAQAADQLADVVGHVSPGDQQRVLDGLEALSRALGEHRRARLTAGDVAVETAGVPERRT
jgi:DNA-binding MarR family transcriptional regulator